MKPLLLTLLLSGLAWGEGPYVVTLDTHAPTLDWYTPTYRIGTMQCSGTKEECQDLAAALNEAHERRDQEAIDKAFNKAMDDAINPKDSK